MMDPIEAIELFDWFEERFGFLPESVTEAQVSFYLDRIQKSQLSN